MGDSIVLRTRYLHLDLLVLLTCRPRITMTAVPKLENLIRHRHCLLLDLIVNPAQSATF